MAGEATRFKKGHHIGRHKGSKAKPWLNLESWYNKLNAEWFNLTANQRAKYSLEAFKCLVSKLPNINSSPAISLKNSEEILGLVKSLEDKSTDVKQLSAEAVKPSEPVNNPLLDRPV